MTEVDGKVIEIDDAGFAERQRMNQDQAVTWRNEAHRKIGAVISISHRGVS
jgi:hypothetical protein